MKGFMLPKYDKRKIILILYSLIAVTVTIEDVGETGLFPTLRDLNLQLSPLRKMP